MRRTLGLLTIAACLLVASCYSEGDERVSQLIARSEQMLEGENTDSAWAAPWVGLSAIYAP